MERADGAWRTDLALVYEMFKKMKYKYSLVPFSSEDNLSLTLYTDSSLLLEIDF